MDGNRTEEVIEKNVIQEKSKTVGKKKSNIERLRKKRKANRS